MNLSGAISVTQLVSTAISTVKSVRDLAKDSSDLELKGTISDLYDALLAVKDRALEVDEENRSLKAALEEKAKYVGPLPPNGYYYQGEDRSNPLCPRCFQENPPKVGFMDKGQPWGNGQVRRDCHLCRHAIFEQVASR
jgi:hypothetical protein